jgi:hypothetical protein
MDNTTNSDSSLDNKLSAIDKALAAATARKAAKATARGETVTPDAPAVGKPPRKEEATEQSTKKSKIDAAAKAAREEEREAARAQRKVEREARKAAKETTAASKKPAHMKKVERAAAKLPALNSEMQATFDEVTTNFSAAQLTALALHLQHFNRVKATQRALNQTVEVGCKVRIIGGEPKFIGKEGIVSTARRIRCFVDVPGVNKPVYLFTSDVEVLQETAQDVAAVG